MHSAQNNNSGQALLVVLLVMAGITTVVLSTVSRSISQVEVTNREEESLRAFSAAEAGIEKALLAVSSDEVEPEGTLTVTDTDTGGESVIGEYNVEVTPYPENSTTYNYPFELYAGDSATVWFIARDGNNLADCATDPGSCFRGDSVELCWGEEGTDITNVPAVLATVIYITGGEYHAAKIPLDPNATANANNFIVPGSSCNIEGNNYVSTYDINFPSLGIDPLNDTLVLLRVRMLYNQNVGQIFGVKSPSVADVFPPQARKVTSTGALGNSTRKISAYITHPTLPAIFDSAIYSPVSIVKN